MFVAILVVPSFTSVHPTPVLAAACSPTQSSVGTDSVLTFANTTACDWTVPAGVSSVRILLIGGGGGGGFDIGGGGGGGGFREVNAVVTTPGEVVSIVAGAGGVGDISQGNPCTGTNGSASSAGFSSGVLTALGGGGGGGQNGGGNCATNGLDGASGGGGGVGLSWPRVGGAGTYASDGDATTFGNSGGNTPLTGGYYAGGGGGGAGATGGNGSSDGNGSIGGAGGAGKSSNITGSSVTYAGGGAGGFFQSGTRGIGGTGGGGNGGTNGTGPTAGSDGLGGGGGGGGVQNCCYGQGARGGNGIVIIRWSVPDVTAPTVSLTSATLNPSQDATVKSTETGTAYIVKSTVNVTTVASITGAAGNLWNTVSIAAANVDTLLPLTGLVSGSYKAYSTDAAGNLSSVSSNSVTVLTDNPTVTIGRSGSGTVGIGSDITVTFTLSESSTNFSYVAGDVTVSRGTLSGFAGSGTTYTATWAPPTSGSGTALISVAANRFTDAAGNQNVASETLSIVWDTNPSTTTTTPGTTTTTAGTTTTLSAGVTTTAATTTTAVPALEIVVSLTTTTVAPSVTQSPGGTVMPNVVVPQMVSTTTSSPASSALRSSRALNVASTTTSSMAPPLVTTTTEVPPQVPKVVTGGAAVESDGKSVKATITRENNQIVVQAGAITAQVAGVNKAGDPEPLDADGNIRIPAGSRVRIRASGFEPASTVDGWLFSTPVRIGSATVDAKGSVDTVFVIPEGTPAGAHRIAIEARSADGKPTTIAVGVRIGDFEKESNIAARLVIALLVSAMLAGLFLPAVTNRRRRRRATV